MSRVIRWLQQSFNSRAALGPLEMQLLQGLWKRGSATVRELIDERETTLAYTTVMTTLDRLHKKGILDRVADGRAFRYSPRQTQEEFNRAALSREIRELLGAAAEPSAPISFLVDAVTEHDRALLDELQRAVERKRRELRKREKR
jgi:predicted transcriptional regulator